MSEVTERRRSKPYAARLGHDERRDQLLDAALAVIVEEGIHKVSIDSVAKAAGITRPVVYRHFDDTNQLLRASLAREEGRVLAQLLPLVAAADRLSLVEGLLAFQEGLLDAVTEAPQRWRAVFTLVDSSTPAFRRRVEAGRLGLVQALEQRLERARGGELDEGVDVGMLARSLFALLWDAGRLVLEDPQEFPVERVRGHGRSVIPALLQAAPA